MPNSHAADKESLSFRINRTLAYKLRKDADRRGDTFVDYLINLFTIATKDVQLDPEDYRQIAQATEEAQKLRKRRSTELSNPKRPKGKA